MTRVRSAEDGFVMLTVILVMAIALMVGGVAVADALQGRKTSLLDLRAKRAQAAADAGVQQMVYRANLLNQSQLNFNNGVGGLTGSLVCAVRLQTNVSLTIAGLTAADAATNCPGAGGLPPDPTVLPPLERLGNRERFRGWYVPNASSSRAGGQGGVTLNPVVVAEGHDDMGTEDPDDDIIRRSEAVLNPVDPFRVVEATGNLTLSATTTTLNGSMRTAGNLTLTGLAHILTGVNLLNGGRLLNTSSLEYGGTFTPAPLGVFIGVTPQKATTGFTRAPLTIPASKPSCDGPVPSGPCPTQFYDAATKRINVPAGQILTLAAGDYVFCDVKVNGRLVTAQTGDATRIYIDSPTSPRCAAQAGGGKLQIDALNPGVNTQPSRNQFYVAGGGAVTINGGLLSGLTQGFFLYAPESTVDVKVTAFLGSIIGKNVTLSPATLAAMVLTQDLNLYNSPLSSSVARVTQRQYVECAPTRVPTNAVADVTARC